MKALLLLALLACEPSICMEPCQGQSATEERAGGIVCWCGPAFAVVFPWTAEDEACAADRRWWGEHAPFPCPQPGGGSKRARP